MTNEYKASDELNNIPLGTAEEERQRAKGWCDTAAQHCRNEDYWRTRALTAEEALTQRQKPATRAIDTSC